MTFTLPSYVKTSNLLENATLVEYAGADAKYRSDDFDGLTAHDKLLRKLAILEMRGTYQLGE